ncbi:hypothetical protein ABLG96_08785 [Nakamurella sp. A5-74]|uniref:Uncharacterized protein n=1 Tax=Nakamurella sp. A5-74 TaxID=3158264 RepID=A0AAU8DSS6_9ACTN
MSEEDRGASIATVGFAITKRLQGTETRWWGRGFDVPPWVDSLLSNVSVAIADVGDIEYVVNGLDVYTAPLSGFVAVFTNTGLLVHAGVSQGDGRHPEVGVQVVSRSSLDRVDIDGGMDLIDTAPEAARVTVRLHYAGTPSIVTIPGRPGVTSSEHRALANFIPSLMADVART